MNNISTYELEDINKFKQINKNAEQEEYSNNLRKLISVKDKISLFNGIDTQDLKAIIYNLEFKKAKRNEYIIHAGKEHDEIYFIIDGECKIVRDNISLAILKPGEIFGESGAIFNTKKMTSVVSSSENTTLLSFCIDENNLEFCSTALAILYKNLARDINDKLNEIDSAYIKK